MVSTETFRFEPRMISDVTWKIQLPNAPSIRHLTREVM